MSYDDTDWLKKSNASPSHIKLQNRGACTSWREFKGRRADQSVVNWCLISILLYSLSLTTRDTVKVTIRATTARVTTMQTTVSILDTARATVKLPLPPDRPTASSRTTISSTNRWGWSPLIVSVAAFFPPPSGAFTDATLPHAVRTAVAAVLPEPEPVEPVLRTVRKLWQLLEPRQPGKPGLAGWVSVAVRQLLILSWHMAERFHPFLAISSAVCIALFVPHQPPPPPPLFASYNQFIPALLKVMQFWFLPFSLCFLATFRSFTQVYKQLRKYTPVVDNKLGFFLKNKKRKKTKNPCSNTTLLENSNSIVLLQQCIFAHFIWLAIACVILRPYAAHVLGKMEAIVESICFNIYLCQLLKSIMFDKMAFFFFFFICISFHLGKFQMFCFHIHNS